MKETNSLYDRKISRGSQFKFMWLDTQREVEWGKLFNVNEYPSIIVLNPGKRKRYLVHGGDISTNSISKNKKNIFLFKYLNKIIMFLIFLFKFVLIFRGNA